MRRSMPIIVDGDVAMAALVGRFSAPRFAGILKSVLGVILVIVAGQVQRCWIVGGGAPAQVADTCLRVRSNDHLVTDHGWVKAQNNQPVSIALVMLLGTTLKHHGAFNGLAVESDLHRDHLAQGASIKGGGASVRGWRPAPVDDSSIGGIRWALATAAAGEDQ